MPSYTIFKDRITFREESNIILRINKISWETPIIDIIFLVLNAMTTRQDRNRCSARKCRSRRKQHQHHMNDLLSTSKKLVQHLQTILLDSKGLPQDAQAILMPLVTTMSKLVAAAEQTKARPRNFKNAPDQFPTKADQFSTKADQFPTKAMPKPPLPQKQTLPSATSLVPSPKKVLVNDLLGLDEKVLMAGAALARGVVGASSVVGPSVVASVSSVVSSPVPSPVPASISYSPSRRSVRLRFDDWSDSDEMPL